MAIGATNPPPPAASNINMMPGGGRHSGPANFNMPSRTVNNNPTGWFVAAVLLGIASLYWYVIASKARTEVAVIREWVKSAAVKSIVRGAIQTSGAPRKKFIAAQKSKYLAAFKTVAQNAGAKELASNPVPFVLSDKFESKLLKTPAQAIPALQNIAADKERAIFPLYPALASDNMLYGYTGWALLGGTVVTALFGSLAMMPKKRPAFAPVPPVPASVPTMPVITPRIAVPAVPTIVAPVATTPFPPPPDSIPTINPPMRGSIAAGVAAVASSSAEVTRLVKRLEELESLSEQLKDERDETRKELSWTQVALDDFKKRVSDATTMAAASAAQSAGASEQRAAQAEQRVTEAVEHINEALQRAVETEHGVSRAQEMAQTAEERAAHAEVRSHEMQFQLARAMERLADLERLAATARIGGVPASPMPMSGPMSPPALPAPDMNSYRNGHSVPTTSVPSPIDDMLAAAAKPVPKPIPDAVQSSETLSSIAEASANVPDSAVPASNGNNSRGQRTPPPRLTTTKMSDIEAGLKLARSIRSRTQKAAANLNNEE